MDAYIQAVASQAREQAHLHLYKICMAWRRQYWTMYNDPMNKPQVERLNNTRFFGQLY